MDSDDDIDMLVDPNEANIDTSTPEQLLSEIIQIGPGIPVCAICLLLISSMEKTIFTIIAAAICSVLVMVVTVSIYNKLIRLQTLFDHLQQVRWNQQRHIIRLTYDLDRSRKETPEQYDDSARMNVIKMPGNTKPKQATLTKEVAKRLRRRPPATQKPELLTSECPSCHEILSGVDNDALAVAIAEHDCFKKIKTLVYKTNCPICGKVITGNTPYEVDANIMTHECPHSTLERIDKADRREL